MIEKYLAARINYLVGQRQVVRIRPAERKDLPFILNVEWACFPTAYDERFSPQQLLQWFQFMPKMFAVAETLNEVVVGYSCLVPLSSTGYEKFLKGICNSIVGLEPSDVDISVNPKFMSLEMIASIDPKDVITSALLVRNMISQVPKSVVSVTAGSINKRGQDLIERMGFELAWKHLIMPGGYEARLYVLNLRDSDSTFMKKSLSSYLERIIGKKGERHAIS